MMTAINACHLRAALACAATQDIRNYLNGIFCEVRPTETRLVATNGEIAAVLRDVVTSGLQPDMPDVIIPNDTVKLALQTKNAALSLQFEAGTWSLAGIRFNPVNGRFPDYRRIIPSKHSGDASQFSVELLSAFLKVGKALGLRSQPIIRHNGDGDAQVSFYGREDEFVGVIMPLRTFNAKNPDPGLIQWGSERYTLPADLDLA